MIRKVTDRAGIRSSTCVLPSRTNSNRWNGKKTLSSADTIVKRGNEQLERFQKANEGWKSHGAE
jgi:sn-glycerol 3-phosphate transport system substrate-binding protein